MRTNHTNETRASGDVIRLRHITLVVAAAAIGCGPDVYTGDPADAVFTSDVGYTKCSSWGLPTPQEWGLFDLFVAADAGGGPAVEHLQRIREVGGLVVHEYAVPIVRAVVRPKDLRYLKTGGIYEAHGVMVPDEYPVTLYVRIEAPEGVFEPDDEDRQRDLLESLGAEPIPPVRYHESGNRWNVIIPDESIPMLRQRDDVVDLWLPSYGCLAVS